MRVAWFGPEPGFNGGVPYVATQILSALPAAGVSVDAYISGDRGNLGALAAIEGLRLIHEPSRWRWDRWYSRNPLLAVISGQAARIEAQRRLVARLLASGDAYDLIYQFSQIESPWSRATARRLPPVVVHPEVHAAGELRWHRRERNLSRQCEPLHTRLAVDGILTARAAMQRRGSRAVDAFVAPSSVFARDLSRDYAIDPERLHVVPNPIDLNLFTPGDPTTAAPGALSLVYVSRIALRKGVEMIVALSHRLSDLAGTVRLRVVGDRAMFSNYKPLLDGLNPSIATYDGPRSTHQLASIFREADLLLQPSHYEPFALTVGEALASGVPVVASDQVGAAEAVDRRACRIFPSGDLDAFEAAVRRLIGDLRSDARPAIRGVARSEAARLFTPATVAQQLAGVFKAVASGPS